MSSLIPHDYRYKISSPTPVDKEPIKKEVTTENSATTSFYLRDCFQFSISSFVPKTKCPGATSVQSPA